MTFWANYQQLEAMLKLKMLKHPVSRQSSSRLRWVPSLTLQCGYSLASAWWRALVWQCMILEDLFL